MEKKQMKKNQMQASVTSKYGPPELLKHMVVEKPIPQENEILIKVFATTVNRTDTTLLRAIPLLARLVTGLFKPKKPIPGTEFAGKVEEIGKEVTSFQVGDQVCGFNEDLFGSHAQYMTIAEDKAVVPMPPNLTYEEATACMEGGHYAYNNIKKMQIKEGASVLVNGATGGIGSAAVQVLKYFGAHVTATCRTEHMELVTSLGADEVMDYTKQDFTQMGGKFDFIFDAVGKSTFGACKPSLNPQGVYCSSDLGPWCQNIFYILATPLFGDTTVIMPLPLECREDIIFIKKLIEEGKYKPLIDRTYSLKDIVEAYKYVEKGQKVGNVVITVEH